MTTTSTSFPKTRWTLIQKVRSGTDAERTSALNDLCQSYWFPLYAYARKTGLTQEEAEDAVQTFMLSVVDSDLFAQAEKERGHLRTLLLTCFTSEIRNRHKYDHRLKRGGGMIHVPFDLPDAEGLYQIEIASSELTADVIFHRQWAKSLIKRALERLKERYDQQGLTSQFKVLRTYLPLDDSTADTTAGAAAAGMTPGSFRTALHRTRARYRRLIMDEVSQTIGSDDPELIQNEIQALFQVLSH